MKEISRTYFLGCEDLQAKREKLAAELARRDYTYNPHERKNTKTIYYGNLLVGNETSGRIEIKIANHPEGMKLSRLLNVLDI